MIYIFLLLTMPLTQTQTCNKQPYQPELCVFQANASCWFNYYENSCVLTNTNSEGCSPYLNRLACTSQLFSGLTYAKCYFSDRCNEITHAQQVSLGCDNLLSKYACLSLLKSNCEWKDNHCQNITQIGFLNRCQDIQGSSSPSACLQIPNEACISGGYEFDFNCQQVTDFSKISCSNIGLNLKGCVQVSKSGENCIFIDGYCQQLLDYQDVQCDSFINRSVCITIMNPERKCQWKDNVCQNLTDFGKQCTDYTDVNPTLCSQISSTKCYYKEGNCVLLDNMATCDSLGINKLACDSFSTPCVFYNYKCQTINVLDNYKCSNQLNKAGCLSLQTRYQYCQWDTKCVEVFITQDTLCNLSDVNGNTCRAIIKESCKYNQITQKCEKPDNLDGCTTPFINLKGCVSVDLLRNSCRWFNEQCQLIKVDKYNTKCSDLKYSNGISCSQVYYENDVNELNCYYDSQSQGCASFLTGDQSLKCTQIGLNELGCTNIRMIDNICRWSRGKCVQVLSKSEMQAFPCLSVSSVNAQTCALIVYNKEPCKFNLVSQSCISSVDYNNDTCNTPGLNSFGCSSLVTQKCYYDTKKWRCRQLEAVDEVSVLNNIICTDNYPTKLVCTSITNLTQFCGWSVQQSVCQSIQLTPWKFCLDYQLVNPNVCSAVLVTSPNAHDSQGYCGYDSTTWSCNIFVGPCTTNCCEEEKGINTHVCSRNSDATTYCYFDKPKLKCSQVILEDYTDTYAKAYITNNKLTCEQVNYAMCNLVEWSYEQYCFQQSTTDRCHSVIFNDIDDYSPFTLSTSKVSRITCQAVPKASIYFVYDTTLGNCQYLQEDQSYACETEYVNINVCTRLTGDDYCLWDPSEMKCTQISDIESQGCSQFLNQNGCVNIQDKACKFELNYNRCSEVLVTDLTDIMGCDYLGLSQNRRTSQLSCSLIYMKGQACQYDAVNHQCFQSNKNRSSCYLFGSNMFDCYENTTSLCQWNAFTLKCQNVNASDLPTLTCTSNVNKIICLQLTSMACTWNLRNMQCENEIYVATKTCQDLINTGNQYNSLACTQITGNGSFCHWEQNLCKITKTKLTNCSAIPLNMYSCLIMTNTAKCFYENGQCKTFTGSSNIQCNTPNIGVEVCISITGNACKFDIVTYSCQEIIVTNTTKCSTLSNPNFYNNYACISISSDVPNNADQSYQVCGSTYCGYEKYCIWNSSTYACEIQKLNSEQISYYFDNDGGLHYVCRNKYYSFNSCSSNYSKALCLELVNNNCFFELSLGGCKTISGRENQPQSCDALNYYSCPLVSTAGLSCSSQAVSNDGCINPKKIQFSCNSIDPTGQACSFYSNISVSRNVCSNLSGYCYWSGSKCKSINSGSGYCELAGLSIDACSDLGICNSGIPCTSSVSGSTYTTCDEIDQNLSGIEQQVACAQLVMNDGDPNYSQSCGYLNNSCIRLDRQKSCQTLAAYIQGPDACLKYSLSLQQSCTYQDNKCILVTTDQFSCSNLNKYACLKWTTEVYCLWINDECVEETQSNLSTYTDCTIANNDACFYINAPCWIDNQLCIASSALTQCQIVKANQGNELACSFVGIQSDSCYFDSDNSQCTRLQSSGQACDTPGLNIASCVKMTTGQCYFDGTQCKTLTDYNINCNVANQTACLLLTLEPCYWNSWEQQCKTVIPVIPQYCFLYSVIPSNFFNTLTCSRINNFNQFCALKPGKTVCYAITTATCDLTGINYQACTQKTTDYCYFENDKCLTVDSFAQDCDAKFNSKSCLKLTNQVCYFNVTCQLYDFSILNVANVGYYTTIYTYSDRVCSQISLTDIYLYYNNLSQKCVKIASYTAPFLSCDQVGINKNACLMKTNQYCTYANGKCMKVKLSDLSSQTCTDQEFNGLTCIDLKYSACYFSNYQCLPINPTSTCSQLSNVQTNIYSCASRTDVACSHNLTTRFCVTQTSTTLLCTETGLNRIGCLNKTSNKRCIFDDSRLSCLEGILDTYVCSDIINDKNCALVSVPGQFCYFNNTCQTQTAVQLNTCVGIYKENGLSCTKATDVPCVFDLLNFKCNAPIGNEDCSIITSLNLLGCKSNKGDSKCFWDLTNQICSTIEDTQLTTLPCTSNINYQSCINITLANQYCQFTTNCIAKSHTDPTNQCALLTNVNRREFCENVNDTPCAFDAINKNCYVVTTQLDLCQRGLNRKACLEHVLGGCLFGTFCYSATDIVMCYQAQTQTQCVGIDAQCQFDGTVCSDFDSTTVPCLDTPAIVSPTVCYSAIAISPFVCIYDTVTSGCKIIQPSKCEEIFDAPSCARYSTQPCLWKNNKCIFYQVIKDSDECITVNLVGTLRTCIDVNKYGQYCNYDESLKQCVTVTSIDQCDQKINYNACISQQKLQCQWDIQIKLSLTSSGIVSYSEGNCKNLDSNQLECNSNLSYLSCLIIIKQNQFCYFLNNQCNSLSKQNITLNQYKLVNLNVCTLVQNVPAVYNFELNICVEEQSVICNKPGINRIGCINVQNHKCKWISDTNQCQEQLQEKTAECLDSDVSSLICQTCTGIEPVYFDNGKCIPITSDTKCTDRGINKSGCINIKKYPCIWLESKCQDFMPYQDCDNVPENVSSQVCRNVTSGVGCKYGEGKCIRSDSSIDNCSAIGLNLQGCVQIKNCRFSQVNGCYENLEQLKCSDIGYANISVCQRAQDQCKFDPISYQCKRPAFTDTCSTDGLSSLGCLQSVNDCIFKERCYCGKIEKKFPQCKSLKGTQECNKDYCYFEDQIVESQGYKLLGGFCRYRTCSDYENCIGYIDGYQCYKNSQGDCIQANSCSDLEESNCGSLMLKNSQQCIFEMNKCIPLSCSAYSNNQCPKQCFIDGEVCTKQPCSHLQLLECQYRKQDCFWNSEKCLDSKNCNEFGSDQCIAVQKDGRICGWLTNQKLCTDIPCRYFGEFKDICNGMQVSNEVCVMLNDQSCVHCEEILDSCICLSKSPYCDLDRITQKCYSTPCESYTECPSTCRKVNSQCQALCQNIYNDQFCALAYQCEWSYVLNGCYDKEEQIREQNIFILPQYDYGNITQIFMLLIYLF